MIAFILLLLTGTAGGGWYVYTGYLNPSRTCKKCNGLGFRPFIGGTYTQCKKCDGYGWIFRPAARHARRNRAPARRQGHVRRRGRVQARQTRQRVRPVAR